jgi:chromosome partitioning protein
MAIAFADASEKGLPLAVYDSNHPAVELLRQIADNLDKLS